MAVSFILSNMNIITPDIQNIKNAVIIQQSKRMMEALSLSSEGLKNLQQTYKDDSASNTHIQIIISEIQDFFDILKKQNYFNLLKNDRSAFGVDVLSDVSSQN